jgi:hypothetical protein
VTELLYRTHTEQKGVVQEITPFYRVYQNTKKLKIYCKTQRLINAINQKDKTLIKKTIKELIPKRHE